jgi:hypothetical protein
MGLSSCAHARSRPVVHQATQYDAARGNYGDTVASVVVAQPVGWSFSEENVLQKSKAAGPRIFREKTKREAIADS